MTQRVRVLLQPAYVLHRRPYRDTSALLDVFTPEFGRVGLVARGARQAKSRSAALLQPFQPVWVSWSGSGELCTLSTVEDAGAARWLTGVSLMSGLYLNELLVRLLHRFDPHPSLFACYENVLAELAQPPEESALEASLRIFENRLLAEIGYGLVLEHEADSDVPIEAARVYAYHVGEGPRPYETSRDANSILTVHGATLLAIARECFSDVESLREAKRLMRAALVVQLGSKPLASRRLFAAPS